jgi:hypothetical protein
MVKMNNGKKGGKNHRKNTAVKNLDQSIVYKGPISLPQARNETFAIKRNCSKYVALTANGSGVLDVNFASGDVTGITDWSSIQQTYHEYRVLGFEIKYIPYRNYVTTNQFPPLISVVDHSTNGSLTSYANAVAHESADIHSAWNEIKRVAKMNGSEEAVWTTISTTFSWGWIKLFGTGFANTQPIGGVMVEFLLELRGAF